jgi:uncharacterized protein (TIGR02246 family)
MRETETTLPMSALSRRVQRLEDRFAINDLIADYCNAIDDRDLEKFLALFTEDAVLRHKDGVMRLNGKPAIRDYYGARFANYGVTFHYPHSCRLSFEGRGLAAGVVTGHAEMGVDGRLVIAAIRYTDQYRQTDAGWCFAERELAFWYYMDLAELPAGFSDVFRKHYRGERLPAELPDTVETFKAWRQR